MSHQRDRAIEFLLDRRMKPSGGRAGPCLDAETLAAWSEGALSGEALAAAEAHAADCARCQMLLAAMARTKPIEPLAKPRRLLLWLVPFMAATTPTSASVTTADGRTLRTVDSGKTWTP
jgi:hypothetical protein